MLDTLIHDAILVTMAGDGLGIVVGGALGIRDGQIVCVGETGAVRDEHTARRYIDGTDKIVMPGLINAHTHSFGTLNRGILAETEAYLEEGMVGYMDAWTADSLRASTRLHVLEGLKRGITTFCDNTIMLGDTAHVFADMGVRARLSPMTREMSWDYQSNLNGDYEFNRSYAHREFDDTIRLLERYGADPNERVSIIVGFQALDYVTRELAIECRELARKHASMLAVHLAQSEYEIEQCERRYGKRPLAVLDELDILNDRTVAAHMALNTPEENAVAAKSGLNLAFCPSVWGQIGMSPPAAEYLDMGGRGRPRHRRNDLRQHQHVHRTEDGLHYGDHARPWRRGSAADGQQDASCRDNGFGKGHRHRLARGKPGARQESRCDPTGRNTGESLPDVDRATAEHRSEPRIRDDRR